MLRSAAALGLYGCRACGLVSRRPEVAAQGVLHCPRCATPLHARKPDSLRRTTALLLAAAALYVPANTLPIVDTHSLFNAQRDTILSGTLSLWNSGSPATAALVFCASIVVPLLKLVALGYLVLTVRRGSLIPPLRRTRLYRLLTWIGRWSMLDIYVVAVLVSLVHIETLAVVTAGAGAHCFGAVVVLTMLATLSFDPRLLWDRLAPPRG